MTVGGDEFDDPNESFDEEPAERPARTKKKPKKKRSGASVMSSALPILGKLAWVIGVINLIGSLPVMLFFLFGFGILGAFIYLLVGPVWVYFGMKGPWGKGIPISSEKAIDGNLGIVIGIVLIFVGSISPLVINRVVIQMKAAKWQAAASMDRPDFGWQQTRIRQSRFHS